ALAVLAHAADGRGGRCAGRHYATRTRGRGPPGPARENDRRTDPPGGEGSGAWGSQGVEGRIVARSKGEEEATASRGSRANLRATNIGAARSTNVSPGLTTLGSSQPGVVDPAVGD